MTDADQGAERALRDALAQARPSDAFGEEFGGTTTSGTTAGRIWIIDPIDGTKNFVRGVLVSTHALTAPVEDGGAHCRRGERTGRSGRRWWAGCGRGRGYKRRSTRTTSAGLQVSADAEMESASSA